MRGSLRTRDATAWVGRVSGRIEDIAVSVRPEKLLRRTAWRRVGARMRVADATAHLPASLVFRAWLPQELAPQRELPPAGCPGFEGPFPQPVLMSCAVSSSPGEDRQTARKRAGTTPVDAHICPTRRIDALAVPRPIRGRGSARRTVEQTRRPARSPGAGPSTRRRPGSLRGCQ